jgi:ERCC4-type nuclease
MPKTIPQSATIHLVVDDREAHSPILKILEESPRLDVQIERLEVGDYLVNRRCVFERKTLPDFAASIADGRLFVQAQKLAGLPDPAAIILEGQASDLAATQMRRESFQGAIVSLSLIFRLPVLRARDPSETAQLIIYAAEQMRRHESDQSPRYGRRPNRKRKAQLWLLQGLPGVGPARALQLIEAFGSVQAVMMARPYELEQVTGIGPKTAAAIRDILQEAAAPYGKQLVCHPSKAGTLDLTQRAR